MDPALNAEATTTTTAPDTTDQTPADLAAPASTGAPDTGTPAAEATAAPGAKAAAFLDSLSETPAAGTDATAAADTTAAAAEAKPGDAPAAATDAAGQPLPTKTAEQEEAELLEGVKSPRGKERIKAVFAKSKELETDIKEFRELVGSTGMSPQDFAQSLEYGRLVNSGKEADIKVALEMVEAQRTALYARLGVEAPGVDLLEGHDDLKAQVENLEITRAAAVELAKHRKNDSTQRQRQQTQEQSQQDQQQFVQTVQQASTAMEAYLETRKNEVDHIPRMKVLSDHFRDPAKMQAFVTTYRPDQWAATVKMMYDNVTVARPAGGGNSQPLRSRPANLGQASTSGQSPMDRMMSRMDQMGL